MNNERQKNPDYQYSVLANGQAAQATFNATLDELGQKVAQLGKDLAAQDGQAFLNHS